MGNNLNEQLPEWANGKAKSYTDLGAQLCTRDGRKCGNAVLCLQVSSAAYGKIAYRVITDMGSKMVLTLEELEELFYPPKYTMNVGEALTKRLGK